MCLTDLANPQYMVSAQGFEPRTHALEGRCSIQLSYAPIFGGGWWIRTTEIVDNRFTVCPLWPLGKSSVFGASDRNRTYNLLITSQLLYR